MPSYDAVVVGAGPNGLGAAITLAEAGQSVIVFEANGEVGGAARSAAWTRPGFVHDVGSAIHPLGVASPLLRRLPLAEHGLEWIWPDLALAHPLGGRRAAALHRSLAWTAQRLGADGAAYERLMAPLSRYWKPLLNEILQPVLHWPRHPVRLAQFGLRAIWPAEPFARISFREDEARALWAGLAAHSALSLRAPGSAAFGLVLGLLGHAVGWPFPRGGAGQITRAMAKYLEHLGGTIVTGHRVDHVDEVPPSDALLLDVTPRQLLRLAEGALPGAYRRRLEQYRYGAAAFKLDYALSEPIPWAAEACRAAGTVHLGGSMAEIAEAEHAVAQGQVHERPFVLLAQHSLFDSSRAPDGQHTMWAYAHVPNGSTVDATPYIEAQIERFAPGFRDVVIERAVTPPAGLEADNSNLVGGDVNGGALSLPQLIARPVLSLDPYRVPAHNRHGANLVLCSASTPPGGGVHGMCGYHAAQSVLRTSSHNSYSGTTL